MLISLINCKLKLIHGASVKFICYYFLVFLHLSVLRPTFANATMVKIKLLNTFNFLHI